MVHSKETYRVKTVHSGGDTNQTYGEFKASKCYITKIVIWSGYENAAWCLKQIYIYNTLWSRGTCRTVSKECKTVSKDTNYFWFITALSLSTIPLKLRCVASLLVLDSKNNGYICGLDIGTLGFYHHYCQKTECMFLYNEPFHIKPL